MNTSTPRVSVVLPVFNGKPYVAEAIDSILAQTLRDFELVIVDNASTDGTLEILEGYERRDARVRIFRHQTNQGFRTSLNHGCRQARAELVAKMAADDVAAPQRLEKQVAFLASNPDIGILGTNVQVIDEMGRKLRVQLFPTEPALVAWSMLLYNSLAHPSVMMRRQLFDEYGYYPAGFPAGTIDYALFMRLGRSTRMANLPELLLSYRIWSGQMTSQKWTEQELEATKVLRSEVADCWGIELSDLDALRLRGLARDEYPGTTEDVQLAAQHLEHLTRSFLDSGRWTQSEARAVKRQAGIRLWLLAALAVRRSPALAGSIGYRAGKLSPGSLLAFSGKVGRRLWSGRRRRAS